MESSQKIWRRLIFDIRKIDSYGLHWSMGQQSEDFSGYPLRFYKGFVSPIRHAND